MVFEHVASKDGVRNGQPSRLARMGAFAKAGCACGSPAITNVLLLDRENATESEFEPANEMLISAEHGGLPRTANPAGYAEMGAACRTAKMSVTWLERHGVSRLDRYSNASVMRVLNAPTGWTFLSAVRVKSAQKDAASSRIEDRVDERFR